MIGRQNKTVIKKQDDKQVLLRISDLDTESLNSFLVHSSILFALKDFVILSLLRMHSGFY